MGEHDHSGHMNHGMPTPASDMLQTTIMGMHDGHHDHHEPTGGSPVNTTGDPHAGHNMPGMDMMMYFHARISETILFETWNTKSIGGLIGSMIGIFLMALFYEGLKYYREYLFRRTYATTNFNCIGGGDGPKVVPNPLNSIKHRMFHRSHLVQSLLHMVQVTLSYFLMLIFMTYNVWLCLAVVLGAGVGFFIFGWKKAIVVDITEHCH